MRIGPFIQTFYVVDDTLSLKCYVLMYQLFTQ
jgi:hypothetical protein